MPFDGRAFSLQQEILAAIDVLERAREIVRHRWVRGAWMMPWPARPHAYCAAGALAVAVHGEGEVHSPAHLCRRFERLGDHLAVLALMRAAGVAGAIEIMCWNDAQVGGAEVVAGFDRAIADLRSQLAVEV